MAEFPAMPLWTDALLADCGHLTDAELGLYLKLLIQMWRAPDGTLPDDDEWLAKRFGRSVEVVQRDLRPLIAEFCQKRPPNRLTQRRLQRELEYVRKHSRKQSENAKSGWDKKKDLSHGMPVAYAKSMPRVAYPLAMPPHPHHNKTTTSEQEAETPKSTQAEKEKAALVASPALLATKLLNGRG